MNRVLAVIALVLACVLSALASPAQAEEAGWRWTQPTVTVYVPFANDGWRVRAAVRAWEATGVVDLHLTRTPCTGCITIQRGPYFSVPGVPKWLGLAVPETSPTDWRQITNCKIRLVGGAWKPYRPTVIVHELGHCLGLGHSDEGGALMNVDDPTRPTAPTEADVAALRVLYAR